MPPKKATGAAAPKKAAATASHASYKGKPLIEVEIHARRDGAYV